MKLKNENRPGYKKTKVGWIPEGWKIPQLNELGQLSKGAGISKEELSVKGVPCIRYGEIYTFHNFVLKEFQSFISPSLAAQSVRIKENDLLFAGSGETAEEIGKSVAYMDKAEAYAGGDIILLSVHPEKGRADYLSYYLNTVGRKALNRLGQGQSVVHIYPKNLAHVQLPLPPLPEQEAIAEVLECWDKGIRTLEKKIERKRLIKKGLMQKLLSGKIRLPGFPKVWKTVRLGEIATIKTGKKDVNQGNPEGKYPFFTCAKTHTYSDEYSFDTEAILIAGNGEVGHCLYYSGKFEAYQRTYVLYDFASMVSDFLFACLRHYFQAQIEQKKQMGAMPYIKLGMLTGFELPLPPPEEQQAIAEVLSAADGEIEALEKKRTLWKEQKKYLLNNLVTGTIRLPEFVTVNERE